ncbi:alpha/beta fold hydrolase [Marivita sp. S6314]|uniref:alpha/beta fold hydrolase BchO n=1 Tax=Marivita sp. S6314 TaxID=2926406 RepID=UPI001FF35C8B|nr:alpha/beta fold hydrolase BchO [Marivita sp. S6314]MCK0151282.1 alpha/beta fold hydrolase [Marivita sp. S6314]
MGVAETLTAWPHAEHSRFIDVRPHHWHVQEMGRGDTLLLLHGASGSTHSWRDMMTNLAKDYHVVAIDLPGHGQTKLGSRHRSSLTLMTQDVQSLLDHEGWKPKAVLAHSAGAALALRLLQTAKAKVPLIAVNPALTPFKGLTGVLFPMAARIVAMSPMMVNMVNRRMSDPGQVVSLMATTGSNISPEGLSLYAKLFRNRDHIDGTLLMMAQWKLDGLLADLPRIDVPCTFLIGENDKAVPPSSVRSSAEKMQDANVISVPGYGHLLHEEAPELVADQLRDVLRKYT